MGSSCDPECLRWLTLERSGEISHTTLIGDDPHVIFENSKAVLTVIRQTDRQMDTKQRSALPQGDVVCIV